MTCPCAITKMRRATRQLGRFWPFASIVTYERLTPSCCARSLCVAPHVLIKSVKCMLVTIR